MKRLKSVTSLLVRSADETGTTSEPVEDKPIKRKSRKGKTTPKSVDAKMSAEQAYVPSVIEVQVRETPESEKPIQNADKYISDLMKSRLQGGLYK